MAREIGDWLEDLGLAKYAEVFLENEIDLDTLAHLGDADLRELGLPMGPRKKLLAAITARAAENRYGQRCDYASPICPAGALLLH